VFSISKFSFLFQNTNKEIFKKENKNYKTQRKRNIYRKTHS
jgi:hypothetical protein